MVNRANILIDKALLGSFYFDVKMVKQSMAIYSGWAIFTNNENELSI